MKFMKKLESIWATVFTGIALACMIGLFLILMANIILRIASGYITINYKMSWYSDVVGMLFAYMVMFASAVLCQKNAHFRVDLLQIKLGHHRWFYLLDTVAYAIAFVFYAMFLYYSYILTINANAYMTILPITMFWSYLCMPVAAFFLCVFSVRDVVRSIMVAMGKLPIPEIEA